MNTKIKICGLKREEDIGYVNLIMPDYIGFVFAPSKRQITQEQAKKFREKLNTRIPAVGVFVNAPFHEIVFLTEENIIQMIQLHGSEDEEYIERLKNYIDVPIIKAVKVEKKEDVIRTRDSPADYLLFDQGAGGSGRTFDWSLLSEEIVLPFFLAGGLKGENIGEAIAMVSPFGVDISSGVETDGHKDYEKMQEIVNKIRLTNKEQ